MSDGGSPTGAENSQATTKAVAVTSAPARKAPAMKAPRSARPTTAPLASPSRLSSRTAPPTTQLATTPDEALAAITTGIRTALKCKMENSATVLILMRLTR